MSMIEKIRCHSLEGGNLGNEKKFYTVQRKMILEFFFVGSRLREDDN